MTSLITTGHTCVSIGHDIKRKQATASLNAIHRLVNSFMTASNWREFIMLNSTIIIHNGSYCFVYTVVTDRYFTGERNIIYR